MARGQERQDVHVAVPEHVAAVRRAGQAARTHRRLATVANACHQVKQRQPDGELQLGVALDQHVGVLPSRCPGATVLAQQVIEAELMCAADSVSRGAFVGDAARGSLVCRDAVQHPLVRVAAQMIARRRRDRVRMIGHAHPAATVDRSLLGRGPRRLEGCGEGPAHAPRPQHRRRGPGERGQQQRIDASIPRPEPLVQ